MSQRNLKHYEQRLLHERERVLETLGEFEEQVIGQPEDDGELTNYPLHFADEGTDTIEREKNYMLAGQEGRLLQRIDEALRTIYKEPDRYGCCEVCGQDIADERLELVPWATRCVQDEQAAERG
ncbi:MAG: TraR/DksA family transcriptional regulator [Longimicrobiales bacterium]